MTIGQIIAVTFLVVLVAFVIRGIWGHKRHGDGSDNVDSWGTGGGSLD